MEGIHFKEVLTYASCDFIIQVQVFFDCKNVEGEICLEPKRKPQNLFRIYPIHMEYPVYMYT